MNWNDLSKTVIGLGAPILGTALGGPLGGAAGKLLADALGAAPMPESVQTAIAERSADSTFAAEAAQKAEAEWAKAMAEIGRTQLAETGATMRAEAAATYCNAGGGRSMRWNCRWSNARRSRSHYYMRCGPGTPPASTASPRCRGY
jgi:hypothetical protein